MLSDREKRWCNGEQGMLSDREKRWCHGDQGMLTDREKRWCNVKRGDAGIGCGQGKTTDISKRRNMHYSTRPKPPPIDHPKLQPFAG